MKYFTSFVHSLNHPLHYISFFYFGLLLIFMKFFDFYASVIILGLGTLFLILSIYSITKPEIMIIGAISSSFIGLLGALMPGSPLPITIFQIFLLLSIMYFMLNRIQTSNFVILYDKIHLTIILLIIFMYFSSFYSHDRANALFLTTTFLALFIFSIITSETFTRLSTFKILFYLIIGICALLSIFSIYQFVLNPQNILLNYLSSDFRIFGRQAGTRGDPNQFGILLVFPLLFLFTEIFINTENLKEVLTKKLVYLSLFLLLFSALLVTYSRSSWLAFIIAVFALFIITKKVRKLLVLILLFVLVLFILGFGSLFFSTVINRILTITDVSLDISNTTRIILAKAGINMFLDSMFWGNGYRSFRVLAPHYYDVTKTIGIVDTHNFIIELLADLGLIGLFLFLYIYISFLRKGMKLFDNPKLPYLARSFLLTLIAYLIALFIFYQFYGGVLHDNLMWFCFGGILAINKISTKISPTDI